MDVFAGAGRGTSAVKQEAGTVGAGRGWSGLVGAGRGWQRTGFRISKFRRNLPCSYVMEISLRYMENR